MVGFYGDLLPLM